MNRRNCNVFASMKDEFRKKKKQVPKPWYMSADPETFDCSDCQENEGYGCNNTGCPHYKDGKQ